MIFRKRTFACVMDGCHVLRRIAQFMAAIESAHEKAQQMLGFFWKGVAPRGRWGFRFSDEKLKTPKVVKSPSAPSPRSRSRGGRLMSSCSAFP